jgi:hypothetical protein
MRMRTGQLWECRNGACGCEILVVAQSATKGNVNPRCSCGSSMKKFQPRGHAGMVGSLHEFVPAGRPARVSRMGFAR